MKGLGSDLVEHGRRGEAGHTTDGGATELDVRAVVVPPKGDTLLLAVDGDHTACGELGQPSGRAHTGLAVLGLDELLLGRAGTDIELGVAHHDVDGEGTPEHRHGDLDARLVAVLALGLDAPRRAPRLGGERTERNGRTGGQGQVDHVLGHGILLMRMAHDGP